MQVRPLVTLLIALLTGGVASAQTTAPATEDSAVADPKVCENLTVVGSRLAKKRVCVTQAEWAERRRQDREDVEKAQRPLGSLSNCTVSKQAGRSTC